MRPPCLRIGIIVALALLVVCPASKVSAIGGACSLKAYWKFDLYEGTVLDATGNGFQGTKTGDLTLSTDVPTTGFINPYSFSFNGVSTYITVDRPVEDDFTICAWIKTSAPGAGVAQRHWDSMAIAHSETAFIDDDFGFGVDADGNLMFGDGDGVFDYAIHGSTSVNTGAWTHACATRIRSSGSMRVYVNGALDGSGSGSTTSLDSNPHMQIGFGTDGAQHWNGLMDDVRVYAYAFTSDQIADIANGVDACFGDALSTTSSSSSSAAKGGGVRAATLQARKALAKTVRRSSSPHASVHADASTSNSVTTLRDRTCKRVTALVPQDASMLTRLNDRLMKRFGFSCR